MSVFFRTSLFRVHYIRDYLFCNIKQAMNSLPEIVREGFVLLEMLPFRESILPYPQKILSEVHTTLPVIAYRRNEDLLIAIKVRENNR